MSRRYSPDHKALALQTLDGCGGDIALTSHQTGIPERTLRAWRLERQRQLPPPTPRRRQQQEPLPEFDGDLDMLGFVRKRIMDELVHLSANFEDSFALVSPYQRALVLSQLLDRLFKLDAHLKPYEEIEHILVVPGMVEETLDGEVNEYPDDEPYPSIRWTSPYMTDSDPSNPFQEVVTEVRSVGSVEVHESESLPTPD